MFEDYLIFLIILFVAAALVRDEFVFTILYLFTGAYILGRWWTRRALKSLNLKRIVDSRAFIGEDVPVRLEVRNRGLLPLVWLRLHDSLPVELATKGPFNRVVTLGPQGHAVFEYKLFTRKRGCYSLGPLVASSGDVFGMAGDHRLEQVPEYFTVYPRIILLPHLKLPSRSPMGSMRHHQPLYEDPTRVLNKRDYVSGDSLRRVDWKATAVAGRLQVKQYEPSITLETAIFLNLNLTEYPLRARIDATELAIVTAASVANWVVAKKQSVGLNTNGFDPLNQMQRFNPLPIRKGQGHLMRILDHLARIEAGEGLPFQEIIGRECVHLPWGATLLLITGSADETLFDQLFQARRAGFSPVLILSGQLPQVMRVRQLAQNFEIPFFHFRSEMDLETWK